MTKMDILSQQEASIENSFVPDASDISYVTQVSLTKEMDVEKCRVRLVARYAIGRGSKRRYILALTGFRRNP